MCHNWFCQSFHVIRKVEFFFKMNIFWIKCKQTLQQEVNACATACV